MNARETTPQGDDAPRFTEGFGRDAMPGDTIQTTSSDGVRYVARLEPDTDAEPPWEGAGDMHGVVTDWRDLDSKAPGELVLCEDGRRARFYDVPATKAKARRDGWSCSRAEHYHQTTGQRRACAMEQDYQFLRAWCEDRWFYVGVVLDVEQPDGFHKEDVASVWGVDCNVPGSDNSYLLDLANELLTGYLRTTDDDGPCIACGAPHLIADSCLDGAGNPLDGKAGA